MAKTDRILIADDSAINREMLEVFLEDDYTVATVKDGKEVLEDLKAHPETALLLLDLYMPEKNGFEVLVELQQLKMLSKLAVIVITGESSVDVEEKAFDLGVADFIHKPFENRLVRQRIRNVLELYTSRQQLQKQVAIQTATLRKQNEMLIKQAKQLAETNVKIIDVLGTTVEFRHMDSFEHISRVKAFTKTLAYGVIQFYPEYGLTKEEADLIVAASALHDIGKITISDTVLLKPGKLTKEEYDYMKSHTTKGCDILHRVDGIWDEKFAKIAYEICRYHHERFDGRGYPDALVGDEIPLSAQIVSLADVYDALVCKRVYKDAIPKEKAYVMIITGECGVFAPKLLECFRRTRKQMEYLADKISSDAEQDALL